MKLLRNTLLIIVALLLVTYFFLLDYLIKTIGEQQLTEAYGAEVNIGDVSHSLFPATITLRDIQLTDPAKPMQNKVVVGEAFADVEIMPLLKQKLIANQLNIDNVQFAQPRASAGKVIRKPDPSAGFAFPTAEDIPSVDELLANSPLKTTKAVEQAQQTYQTHTDTLKSQYQSLPDKARLEFYKQEIKTLKETQFNDPQALLQAKAKFDELKEQMRVDKAKIEAFKQAAQTAKADLSEAVSALRNAPQQDYQLLQGVFAGDQAALQQVTQSVFGDKAEQYTQYLTLAIQTIAPMLQGDTEDAKPVEINTDGLPKVWIKNARASVNVKGESITTQWQNITDQHALINAATTFTVDAAAGAFWSAFNTSGQFKLDDKGIDAQQNWSLSGVNLDNLTLSDGGRMTAQIAEALLASSGSLKVTDNQVSGTGKVDLVQLALTASGTDNFTSALADALEDISSLAMNIGFSGDINSPRFSIGSNLDKQLVGAIAANLSGGQSGKLSELRDKLNAKAADALGETNAALAQTVDWQALASGDATTLENLLQTQLNNVVDDQKKKLLDKLKGKLGG
ncbi:TIGR03545 family protein [Alteromonas oceanisediminis]|uniref:TIGR03545 family protein n=1 Tax=Alteromonas oceanisediminis TaxID=2836180 RepID=UPI001BDB6A6F|nr:TIGR03545 family protein [Alteromonas oceanisediminis]MBT0585383.1 TIGR03545 family protein [Alteromonas oceanisediminis]